MSDMRLFIQEVTDRYIRENFITLLNNVNDIPRAVNTVSYSDSTRPITKLSKGDIIYNTDDGQLNVWDGAQWTLPDGTAT